MTRLVVLGILISVGVGGIIFGASRNRLLSSLVVFAAVLLAVWFATVAAYYLDWRDADEFLVCTPNCTTSQDVIGTIMVGLPIVLVGWIAAAALIGWRRRARTQ